MNTFPLHDRLWALWIKQPPADGKRGEPADGSGTLPGRRFSITGWLVYAAPDESVACPCPGCDDLLRGRMRIDTRPIFSRNWAGNGGDGALLGRSRTAHSV